MENKASTPQNTERYSRLLSGALYVAVFFLIVAFLWQSVYSFLNI